MPNVDELLEGARDAITVRRVYGEPIAQEELTLVPRGSGARRRRRLRRLGAAGRGYVIQNGDVGWRPAADVNRITLGWQGRLGARRPRRVVGRPPTRAPLAVRLARR
jgi:hypothetical protein